MSDSAEQTVSHPSWRFGGGRLDPVELGRQGGIRSGEVRRERGKSVRERLREEVEANFAKVWSAFEAGMVSDDERTRFAAAVAVLAEAYGRPAVQIAGAEDRPVRFIVQSAFAELEVDEPLELEEGS